MGRIIFFLWTIYRHTDSAALRLVFANVFMSHENYIRSKIYFFAHYSFCYVEITLLQLYDMSILIKYIVSI